MPVCHRLSSRFVTLLVAAAALSTGLFAQGGNAMVNPYRMLENWPHLGDIKPGAAIGIVPDGKGGVWLQHRSEPGDPAHRHGGQHRQALRRDVRVVARALPGPRRQLLGGRQRPVRRHGRRHGREGQPGLQVRSERQAAADAWQGGRLESGHRHVPAADRVPRDARRQHRRSPTATGRARKPTRRTAIAWCGSRATESSSRNSAGTARNRASSSGRTASRSIRRAACSSPIDRTTASRSSTRT